MGLCQLGVMGNPHTFACAMPSNKKDLYQHLLETPEYRDAFYKGDLEKITDASGFRVKVK